VIHSGECHSSQYTQRRMIQKISGYSDSSFDLHKIFKIILGRTQTHQNTKIHKPYLRSMLQDFLISSSQTTTAHLVTIVQAMSAELKEYWFCCQESTLFSPYSVSWPETGYCTKGETNIITQVQEEKSSTGVNMRALRPLGL